MRGESSGHTPIETDFPCAISITTRSFRPNKPAEDGNLPEIDATLIPDDTNAEKERTMSSAIQNRYDFDCQDGNSNGDPDADNSPRIDLETSLGLVPTQAYMPTGVEVFDPFRR